MRRWVAAAALVLLAACGGGETTTQRDRPVSREWQATIHNLDGRHGEMTTIEGPGVFCVYYYDGLSCQFDEGRR